MKRPARQGAASYLCLRGGSGGVILLVRGMCVLGKGEGVQELAKGAGLHGRLHELPCWSLQFAPGCLIL